jgi:hypothetical protein
MTYQLINDDDGILSGIKLTQDDGLMKFIPLDEANTDYQEYLEWTKASPMNVALPAEEADSE